MDAGSSAPSHVPDSVFAPDLKINLVAPWRSGYVAEIPVSSRDGLLQRIREPSSLEQKCAVARIRTFKPLHEVLTQTMHKRAWTDAAGGRRKGPFPFLGFLPPFRDPDARAAVLEELAGWLQDESPFRLTGPAMLRSHDRQTEPSLPIPGPREAAILERLRERILSKGSASVPVLAHSWKHLWEASGRGLVVRWDPVRPLAPARPGQGPEPDLHRPVSVDEPIVGVIDGGHSAGRYRKSIAWQEPAFSLALPLDLEHGNIVSGLLIEAHAWNGQLRLPKLYCRLGVVPAVPRPGMATQWDTDALLGYLDQVFSRHSETKVWNLSANAPYACDPYWVSDLGHRLSRLARKHRVLLVIAAGNRAKDKAERIAPPADAEAAIVVAGRKQTLSGEPGGPCPVSRVGLGPGRMRKPDLSWFSTLRVLGGGNGQASSWATPLVSSAAAHTWKALNDPSPDLVRAILLATTERDIWDDDSPRLQRKRYDHRLGFGSPLQITAPWATPDHAVLLVWRGWIAEKGEYYWENILLPPSLTRGGVFRGHARLVCVLDPQTHQRGTNYFSTRIEASLQYEAKPGRWEQLIGGLKTNTPEGIARAEDAKWDPIRFYAGTFDRKRSRVLATPRLRVRARLFWRDRYLYPEVDLAAQRREVTFALLLMGPDRGHPVHSEFLDLMLENVGSAVIQPVVQHVSQGT